MNEQQRLTNEVIRAARTLDIGYLRLLAYIAVILRRKVEITADGESPFTEEFARYFGGILLVHHALSEEPLTKDKFEHAMLRVLGESGLDTQLAPKGNPGHDITVGGERWSLKTQADRNLKPDSLHISKFMELGRGKWTDESSLSGLRQHMFDHLKRYDRILSLRHRIDGANRHYELVEIPKRLLLEAKNGKLTLNNASKQNPKPGYCRVYDRQKKLKFQLYFDGGTERKLQIQHLQKRLCYVRASWQFKKD